MGGSDWSFNLRKFDSTAFDDSEDDENDANSNSRVKLSSAQDAAESFDLSSREDNVTYNHNPFSIAKINAACRTRSTKDQEGTTPAKYKLTGPLRPVTKEEKERKVHPAQSCRQSALGRHSLKTAPKVARREVVLEGPIPQNAVRQAPRERHDIPRTLRSPYEATSATPVHPSFAQRQTYATNSHTIGPTVHENVPGIPSNPAHIPSLRASRASDSKCPSGSGPTTQGRRFVPPYPFSSPLRPSSQDVTVRRPRASTPSFKREVSIEPSFAMRPPPFLPLKSAMCATPAHVKSVVKRRSSSSRLQNQFFETPNPPINPHGAAPVKLEPDSAAEWPTQLQFFRRTNDFEPDPYGPPLQPPKCEDEEDNDTQGRPCPVLRPLGKPFRSPPTPLSLGKKKLSGFGRHGTIISNEARKTLVPAPISPPLSSEPPRIQKRRRLGGSANAYNFGQPDEDEEWSTLAANKKLKEDMNRRSAAAAQSTGPFQIPRLTNPLPEGRKSGMSATSQRRVITFLPPPLPSTNTSLVPFGNVSLSSSSISVQITGVEPGAIGASPIADGPSAEFLPHGRRRGSRVMPPQRFENVSPRVKDGRVNDPRDRFIRLPSPPTSDDRMADEDMPAGTISPNIDVAAVRERYHLHRDKVRSRKANARTAFNALGFESCGVVFRDDWKGERAQEHEDEIRMLSFPHDVI